MTHSFRKRTQRLWCVLLLLAGGCSFLSDEFAWLDRPAAKVEERPSADRSTP